MKQGEQFGGYTLISRIGVGGMGEVWRAEDPKLRRTVAIKILPPETAADDESNARFLREARTAAQLYHPNIATIHSIEEHAGRQFIVMEYVEGEPLSKAIASGRLNEGEVAFIGKRVAEALAEAHEHGIVHRDIKPDNIVLSGAKVKVLDFGIAKKYQGGALQTLTGKTNSDFRTEAGVILGTIQYMSPEQAMGKTLDGRSDIFSLGVVLFEAATGKLPFSGETTTDTLTRILRDDPPDLRVTHPRLAAGIANIIMKCLAKVPGERYQTGVLLAAALDTVVVASKTGVGASQVPDEVDPDAVTARATPREPMTSGTDRDVASEGVATVSTGPHTSRGAGPWPWIFATVLVAAISIAGTAWYVSRLTGSQPATPPVEPTPAVAAIEAEPTETITTAEAAPSPEPATTAVGEGPGEMNIVDLNPSPRPVPIEGPPSGNAPPPPPVRLGRSTNDRLPPLPDESASTREKAETHLARGLWFVADGDRDAATRSLELAIAIEPRLVRAHVPLGILSIRAGRDERAKEAFAKVVQNRELAHPRETDLARFGLAIASGDLDRAAELCRRVPLDGEFGDLRRLAKERGADCDAPAEWRALPGRRPGRDGPPPPRPRRP